MAVEPLPEEPLPDRVTLTAVAERLAAISGAPTRLDDLDLHLGDGRGSVTLEERFAVAAERLGLDDLERAVLAAVALRDLAPELASSLAELAPAAQGGGATTRAVARLLAGPGVSVSDVLGVLGPGQCLRGLGAVRMAAGAPDTALADRPLVLADRLAAMLLGAPIDDPGANGTLRRVGRSALPFGRAETLSQLTGLLRVEDMPRPPIAVHGPDAAQAIANAAGCGLLCVAAGALADPELARDAVLAATLEGRVLVVDRLSELAAADRVTLPDRLALLPEAVLCLGGPDELAVLENVPAVAVPVALPSAQERAELWSVALGGMEVPADISGAPHNLTCTFG